MIHKNCIIHSLPRCYLCMRRIGNLKCGNEKRVGRNITTSIDYHDSVNHLDPFKFLS